MEIFKYMWQNPKQSVGQKNQIEIQIILKETKIKTGCSKRQFKEVNL